MRSPDADHRREAERQRQLMQALMASRSDAASLPTSFAVSESPERAQRALQAYRANAAAAAERALAAAFPTVQALVGMADFEQLSREHWRAAPAVRGDLGEWGDAFAPWLAAHPGLGDWPYLADCARVDWARHVCERAADSALDAESLNRLGDTDPQRLQVVFSDGFALIESRWPIATIHHAHRQDSDEAFDGARDAIAQGIGESVVIARVGFRAEVSGIDTIDADWTRRLLDGQCLGDALAQADPRFDFTAWLTRALQASWLKELSLVHD